MHASKGDFPLNHPPADSLDDLSRGEGGREGREEGRAEVDVSPSLGVLDVMAHGMRKGLEEEPVVGVEIGEGNV